MMLPMFRVVVKNAGKGLHTILSIVEQAKQDRTNPKSQKLIAVQ